MTALVEFIHARWPFNQDLEEVMPFWQKALSGVKDDGLLELQNVIYCRHEYKKAPNLATVLKWMAESIPEQRNNLASQIPAEEWRLWNEHDGERAWCKSKSATLLDPPYCEECKKLAWNCQLIGVCPADSKRKFVVTPAYQEALARWVERQTKKGAAQLVKAAAETNQENPETKSWEI